MLTMSGQSRRLGTYQRYPDSLSLWVFLCYANSAENSMWAGIVMWNSLLLWGSHFYLSRKLKLLPSYSCLLPHFFFFPSKTFQNAGDRSSKDSRIYKTECKSHLVQPPSETKRPPQAHALDHIWRWSWNWGPDPQASFGLTYYLVFQNSSEIFTVGGEGDFLLPQEVFQPSSPCQN